MYASMVFSFISFLVAVPSAIKVFNWTATMYRGSISYETPMLYALGFIGLFTIGGLTGSFSGDHGDRRSLDRHLFLKSSRIFHYVMVGGMVMAYLGGVHFWFPKRSLVGMYPGELGEVRAL